MYARAKDSYAHARVAQLHRIARDEPDVARARLMCDNIKWESAKVLPKVYGDSTLLKHTDSSGEQPPVFHISIETRHE